MKAWHWVLIGVGVLLLVWLVLRSRGGVKTVIRPTAPSSVPPAPSSVNSALQLATAGANLATTIFEARANNDDSED